MTAITAPAGRKKERVWFYAHFIFGMLFAVTAADVISSSVATLVGHFFPMNSAADASYVQYFKKGSSPNPLGLPFFLCFLYFISPISSFLKDHAAEKRQKAIQAFNGIYRYVTIMFGANLLATSVFFLAFLIRKDAFGGFFFVNFLLPYAVGTYYSIYFTVLYLEPFLFAKLADRFYEGEELFQKKKGLAISLRARLFFTIFNLLVIPMIIIAGFAMTIPDINLSEINYSEKKGEKASDLTLNRVFRDNADAINTVKLIYSRKYNIIGIVLISLAYGIGYIEMLYRGIQRPIDELIKKMDRLAGGDLSVRTTVLSDDEIGRLKYNFNSMVEGLSERERLRETFGKFVSIEIAKHLMSSKNIDLGGEDIEATVLFSDIRNFTAMSEKMSAREVVDFLNEYFSYITEPIMKNHGVINKFIGDAVMAIYSPHLGSADHAADAVRSALGMRESLRRFNEDKKFPSGVRFGVGIHTGTLVAGNIGTKDRLEYTVIGDTVNVASRIESENKTFATDILLSEETVNRLEGKDILPRIEPEKCPPVSVKGKEKPLVLYKI